jgi:hydrogenase nickel incorporation protein HypB
VDPKLCVAVIAGSPDETSAPERGTRPNRRVLHVNGGSAAWLDAATVGKALSQLNLASLDLLIIENVGTLTIPAEHQDLGQDVTVTVFSVAAGDDKARKHRDLIEAADAVLLNKIDLSLAVPFDLAAFRADVRRTNDQADLFEISALSGRGVDGWLDWLTRRMNKPGRSDDASHWFG